MVANAADNKPLPFTFAGGEIAPGTEAFFELPISRFASGLVASLPVRILHGSKCGPVLFVSAAVHGDEITGVEIVRRVLERLDAETMAGTLICVPIVNVFGFIARSRYLPDRRDLNRSFPGYKTGSLAAQIARLFTEEIVERCDAGIDLHSATGGRMNHPQIRISPDSAEAEKLAMAFAPPIIMTSSLREKSLRKIADDRGIPMLLFEGGEGLRLDELSIGAGVDGILRTMGAMDMIGADHDNPSDPSPTLRSMRSLWVRAPRGGLALLAKSSGSHVSEDEVIGTIRNPADGSADPIVAPISGLIVGHATLPVVNRGDALVHIAELDDNSKLANETEDIDGENLSTFIPDEDELIDG